MYRIRESNIILMLFFLSACTGTKRMHWPIPAEPQLAETGSEFYQKAVSAHWRERDSLALQQIEAGNIPPFLRKFVRIRVSIQTPEGKRITARYYVAPDYLSVGTQNNWARIPLSPMAAQPIADSFHCFLPTRKMVNDIYEQASVKLSPVPMYAFRDSTITMWQHHLIIEGQRKGRKGLIAGIKKDLVLSGKLIHDSKPNREAIYGWHTMDGKPIQPLYTGHINWWVDYSHGIRLVYEIIWVNGKPMHYTEVLKDPVLQKLLCDEEWCDCTRYTF